MAGALRVGAQVAGLALWMLAGACSESGPCVDGEPGMHFIIHLPIEAFAPAELDVSYANGAVERFDRDVQKSPWPDPLEVRVPYGAGAVSGFASAVFESRPDPPRWARANFVADLNACVSVEMTLEIASALEAE